MKMSHAYVMPKGLPPKAPIDIEVEFSDAGVILRKQVDRLDATAADGSEQVVLSAQGAGIIGIAQQPQHLGDADRRGDQLGGVLIKEGHHRLMQGLLLLVIAEQESRIHQDPPHQHRSSRRARSCSLSSRRRSWRSALPGGRVSRK